MPAHPYPRLAVLLVVGDIQNPVNDLLGRRPPCAEPRCVESRSCRAAWGATGLDPNKRPAIGQQVAPQHEAWKGGSLTLLKRAEPVIDHDRQPQGAGLPGDQASDRRNRPLSGDPVIACVVLRQGRHWTTILDEIFERGAQRDLGPPTCGRLTSALTPVRLFQVPRSAFGRLAEHWRGSGAFAWPKECDPSLR